MRQLDETDRDILEQLAADGRRPYSDIGREVGLSGPAVSSRVDQLQRLGIIEKFTVTLDESKLRDVVPVLVTLDVEPGATADVYESVRTANGTQQVYRTGGSQVVAHVLLPDDRVDEWVDDVVDAGRLTDYEVDLLAESERPKALDAEAFAVSCAECGSPITSDGPAERVGDKLYQFCCSGCAETFLGDE